MVWGAFPDAVSPAAVRSILLELYSRRGRPAGADAMPLLFLRDALFG